jgi:hypothetical protein
LRFPGCMVLRLKRLECLAIFLDRGVVDTFQWFGLHSAVEQQLQLSDMFHFRTRDTRASSELRLFASAERTHISGKILVLPSEWP